MPPLSTRIALLLAFLALTLACGPESGQPAAGEPDLTAAPTASPDPGRLLNIMIGLGYEMSSLSNALWRDDLAAVATAARAIADHPHVSASERQRIQAALGETFSDFVKGDQRVHQSAVRLAERAAAGDMSATIQELAELQSGCVACHQAFRDALKTPDP